MVVVRVACFWDERKRDEGSEKRDHTHIATSVRDAALGPKMHHSFWKPAILLHNPCIKSDLVPREW